MAETRIDWADKVWNPVTGCTKISEGCRNCYAERMSKRLAGRCGYLKDEPFKVTLHLEKLDEPLKWKKPQRIFVCSMGDWMHDDVPESFICRILDIITKCPQHTFLTLTKRPENFQKKLKGAFWHNLWLGVTVENQQAVDERIPLLLQIPAAKRFISIEPMLGPVDILKHWPIHSGDEGTQSFDRGLDWIILGGETGPNARPMLPGWVRSVRDQCQAAGVPFFFKQWGEWILGSRIMREKEKGAIMYQKNNCYDWGNGLTSFRVGKKRAGHLLDGKEYREWPE